ncbi:MBL fold metallo-hydrolase [Flexivirga meconopsidis]|uniref:MBL fold metallo-hydrolase n=1 Tax=Flexivirga meconopsidis TaxID=2977121 RepID=UPI00223FB929|nr:MBL fold metallo-hydrolase [Flexivirga meconopsidis]
MCEDHATPSDAAQPTEASRGMGRRALLRGASATGVLAGAGLLAAAGPASASSTGSPKRPFGPLELVLLGTEAGPPPEAYRAGISTALVVDGKTYLIDCGRASVTQYKKAGLKYASLEAIFLTHLHADHIADYYNYVMLSGLPSSIDKDMIAGPVKVWGPGPAGALRPAFGGAQVPTVAPANPTPGTIDLTTKLDEAYAYSHNVFLRDNGYRDPRTLRQLTEIAVPDVGQSPLGDTAPPMKPFKVMEDDRVSVSAVLVPHGPVFPAFAFRFDTDHGSVTFSGDTRLNDNLLGLARGSDVLVHEAIADPRKIGLTGAQLDHQLQSHVLNSEVGGVAQRSDVPHLVLSHLVDWGREINIGEWTRLARRGYDGKVTVGQDLMRLTVARR